MGNCGESAAEKHSITREAQDQHAIESYKRAERAWAAGAFNAELAPLTVKGKKGDVIVKEDEEYKRVIYDKVPSLKSAFKQGGSITAANSSPLNDGASALVLMSAAKAKELGITPLAKIICMSSCSQLPRAPVILSFFLAYADAGVEPIDFPIAPTVALPKALEKANLTVNDISLFEINEAFSVVVRIAEKVLSIDPAKINVNGCVLFLTASAGTTDLTRQQWSCRPWTRDWQFWCTNSRVPRACAQVRRVRCGWCLQRCRFSFISGLASTYSFITPGRSGVSHRHSETVTLSSHK